MVATRRPPATPTPPRAGRVVVDLLGVLVSLPLRFLRAVGRGALAGVRAWRAWVGVRDYRRAAEQADKLAEKYRDIRELSLLRWRITLTVLALLPAAAVVVDLLWGATGSWVAAVGCAATLSWWGRRREGQPGRATVLAGRRGLAWTWDPGPLAAAFRDAKLLGRDEMLQVVHRMRRSGAGWAVTIDLPATRKATDVLHHREALASALAVDETQLVVERVRGEAGHAGRVALWVADRDPYAGPATGTPVLAVAQWDVWHPVPFGVDARQRQVDLPLVWTSLLIGALPRQGKTFAARVAVSGAILDPHARLYVADFKAGKDWDAAATLAHRFLSGDDHSDVHDLIGWLEELVRDVQDRYRRMRQLPDDRCPESKVTRELSRDPALAMPVSVVLIDEVHVPLEHREPLAVRDRATTTGEHVAELLTWLARKGPAAGVVLVLTTQRPDTRTIPSGLRAVLGSRFALRVMDWRDSNIVLGDQMHSRGYDSSRLLPGHKGVGILRPDAEETENGEAVATTVRTYYLADEDWRMLCRRGRVVREKLGTLTGHATGARPTTAPAGTPARSGDTGSTAPPEPLSAVLAYLDNSPEDREFVATAELVNALRVDPVRFAQQLRDSGCRPTRYRVATAHGNRQVRGYRISDIRAAAATARTTPSSATGQGTG
ncbi:FtsK/SpoIIIE domain-containing protein [Actinoalloteichus sp. AHMU CJ021]|uniref:FtsK/SpoIIIE domain-containing protein n=1 Tax=Actinoalloteichus sp. AHMU CJ021 TaxID=2072503 RepID=UPI00307B74E9